LYSIIASTRGGFTLPKSYAIVRFVSNCDRVVAADSLRSAARCQCPHVVNFRSRRPEFTKHLFGQTTAANCRKHSSVDQSDFCVFIEYRRCLRQNGTPVSSRVDRRTGGVRRGTRDERVVGKEHGLSGGSLCHEVNGRSIGRQANQPAVARCGPRRSSSIDMHVRSLRTTVRPCLCVVAAVQVQVVLSPF